MAVRRYYTKSGAGARSGGAWSSAKAFSALNADISAGRAGDRYSVGFNCLLDDPLSWGGVSIGVGVSGASGSRIRIESGCTTGSSGLSVLKGLTATPRFFYWPNSMGASGTALFRLTGSASRLEFLGFRVFGCTPDGFIKFCGTSHTDVVIRGISARSIGRVVESASTAALRSIVIEDCEARRIARGFARFHRLEQSTLRNLVLDAERIDLGGENVTQLISIAAGADNVIENVQLRNAVNTRDYVQGDGLVCERDTRRIAIRNCQADGIGDGAFDLKTTEFTMDDCTVTNSKYGVRIWSHSRNVMRRCSIRNPRKYGAVTPSCIEAHGTASIADSTFQAGDGASVFRFTQTAGAAAPSLQVWRGSIRLDKGAALIAGAANGFVELHDVAVNGTIRNGRFNAASGVRG